MDKVSHNPVVRAVATAEIRRQSQEWTPVMLSLQINQFQIMKKELQNEQITRIIQRENVITFKRKNEAKASLKSQKDEQEDAESSKSNHAEDQNMNKLSRKNVPLPELSKERKRLVPRNLVPDGKSLPANYLERQVRQQDNIMLKNLNNLLTSENIKLKTKNSNLEKEIARLQKLDEDPLKNKNISSKESKGVRNDSLSLKIALKNMQRELEDVKKENGKIKASIKFTTISELEIQRDNILQETIRLRDMLEDERAKLTFLRTNQQGMSAMEQKLVQLQQKNNYLQRENNQLKGKSSKSDQKERSSSKMSESEKNLNKMLFNARRTIKQKQRELQVVKTELKKSSARVESLKVLEVNSGLQLSRQSEVKSDFHAKGERTDKLKNVKDKRLMSKSAQKYRASHPDSNEKQDQCQSCRKLKDQNIFLTKQNEKFKADLQQLKIQKTPIGELSKKPIVIPDNEEVDKLQRFLIQRFKAHHLNIEEAAYHLINFSGKAQDLDSEITVGELLQIIMAQPFSILSDRYLETVVTVLCYSSYLSAPSPNNSYTISEDLKLKRSLVRQRFVKFIGSYELMNQGKQEEMFIQIAELITQYQQHILKALTDKRNSETTIPEKEFYQFFKQIDLQKEYIDFMVSQIILESLDIDHLNIYNLFEIFYMPPQEHIAQPAKQYALPGHAKKKFNMIESVVKEEDEEYEQSKSFMESRQKTISKRDQHEEQYEQEGSGFQHGKDKKVESSLLQKAENDQYQQHFQEEKMQNPAEEEKTNEQPTKQASPQHYHIENVEEEYIEDYQG